MSEKEHMHNTSPPVQATVPGWTLFLLHLSCFLLVVCYVNMFDFWAWLNAFLGQGMLVRALPVLVTLAVLLLIVSRFVARINRGHSVSMPFLGLGIVAAFLALAVPDPDIPIKKVHVAEYIILAFLVRHALGKRLHGRRLLVFTILVTWLYGIHDEMLQGLHPDRYYGIRDIGVNGLAGLSGALLGQGLPPGDRAAAGRGREPSAPATVSLLLLFLALAGGVAWLVISLYRNPAAALSAGVLLPLAAAAVLTAVVSPGTVFSSARHHGLQAVFWLATALLAYPLLTELTGWEFV